MRVRFAVPGVVCAMLLVFAIGCAKQEPPKSAAPAAPAAAPEADGKTLFEAKCSVCHGLDRPAALKETKEKWAGIVKEMQAKKADWISDAEASKIVDYLAAQYGKK
jgi:mono/diheme cytochrome c family protein